MKLTVFMTLALFFQASASGHAQQVTISGNDIPVKKVFATIREQTGYVFFYDLTLLKKAHPVTLRAVNAPLPSVLSEVCKAQPFTWVMENRTITLVEKKQQPAMPEPQPVYWSFPVKGVITDEDGKPLEGVSVTVRGSAKGTITNAQGEYSLELPGPGSVLEFSIVGYTAQTVPVAGRRQVNITLQLNVNNEKDIVVVGYGTTSRKDLTGAVSSVSGEELNKSPNTLFDASLTGRATGVQVVKSSGAPGAIAAIRIRGGTSAIGTNEPLYVVDGIPIEMGDGFGNAVYQTDYLNKIPPIANLNPEDIESIDILKDASSAAIYGSRAANGVVIITTKSGKRTGRPLVNFAYHASFDHFAGKQYKMLNADQYHSVVKQAYDNAGAALPPTYLAYPNANANTDWVGLTTHTGLTNDAYLNVSGGSNDGTTLYSLSGSLTKQSGVIRFTDFERRNIRASIEAMLFKKLRFGTRINYSATNNDGNGVGQFYLITKYRPDVPLYDSAGRFGAQPDSVQSNPYARISQISTMENKSVMMTFFGEIELLKDLKFRSSISSNENKGTNVRYTPSTDVFEIRNGRRGSRSDYMFSTNSTIFDNTFTLDKHYNQHAVVLLAGASFTRLTNSNTSLSSVNFQDDVVLNNLGSAGSIQTYGSSGGISGLSSYFVRGNYNFGSRYYFTFTGRADHSTKFGPENRWGFFPSGALAWNIANEKFMHFTRAVDEMKLRVSYGKTGSANFSDFQYATFFGTGSFYNNFNGATANTIPNPDIRWESTYQLDAALDYSFFKRKLYGSVGFFQKITKGMILNRQIIRETGGRNQFSNIGDFLNEGWEIQVSSELVRNKKFSYITDLNLTKYKSKVLKLNGGAYQNMKEGEPLGYFNGYKVAGIFQTQQEIDALNAAAPSGTYQSKNTKPGDFKFVDVNGDGFIGQDDYVVIGKAEPDFYGGWNNLLRFNKLELSAFFNFSVGNSISNQAKRDLVFFNGNTSNYSTMILDSWRTDNTGASLPRIVQGDPNNNRRESDYYIEKASYFKLKNLQLAYVVDNSFLKKALISSIRAYATLSNVFTITGYSGLDPEVNNVPSNNFSQGMDSNVYPQTRTLTLGLDIKF